MCPVLMKFKKFECDNILFKLRYAFHRALSAHRYKHPLLTFMLTFLTLKQCRLTTQTQVGQSFNFELRQIIFLNGNLRGKSKLTL